jgi:uncharacterized protein YndB with AHSA1/START domain
MNTLKPRIATYTTPNDLEVVGTRVFDAPRHLVFDAWTKPELVSRWLLGPDGWTMPICEIDLRPGGKWRYTWKKDDGKEMTMTGVYKEVVRPERVVWTERWGEEWPETVNTLQLVEAGGQTTMTMTMHYASKDVRDMALKTGMTTGIDRSFERLDEILASQAA